MNTPSTSLPKWTVAVIIFASGLVIGRALSQIVDKIGLIG